MRKLDFSRLLMKKKEKPQKRLKIKKKGQLKGFSKSFHSIRTKLVCGFIATVIPIVLLGYLSYNSAANSITETASEATLEIVKQVNKYLGASLGRINDLALQLMIDKDFQSYLTNVGKEYTIETIELRNKISTNFNNYAFSYDDIDQISVILDNNRSFFTGNSSLGLDAFEEITKTDTFKKAVAKGGEGFWVGYHTDIDELTNNAYKNAETYRLSHVRGLKSMYGSEVVGLLIIDLKNSFIAEALEGIDLGNGSQLHLITPDMRDIGYEMTDGDSVPLDEADEESKLVNASFSSSIFESEEAEGSFIDTFKDSEHLILYSDIGKTGLSLVGLVPTANFTERAARIHGITVAATVVAAVFAVTMGLFLAISMGKAISRIIKILQQAAEGDFTVQLEAKRKDELGILAQNFNMMIEKMRELIVGAAGTAQSVITSAGTVAATSKDVALVSHEVARAVEEISKGATAQASDAEQGSTKMRDLATKINAVSEFVESIKVYTGETINQTKQGVDLIADLESKAMETTQTTRSIIEDIQSLDKNSKDIGNIVKVIDGIADQTNLLALNAAIEAARAGDSGRGFAVVADEIRKLAEQSAMATKEISKIIQANQNQTKVAVERALSTEDIIKSQNAAVANTMEAFKKISASMEALVEKVGEVTAGVEDMNNYKDDAVISIQNISAVSEEIAASTEEVSASTQEQLSSIEELSAYAQQLNAAAQELQEAIKKFKIQ
ncbi:MAG: methyl-accepting chemotaxis protein [Clostridiaceae bacterium]|nr:methyl-accepting chemotaxis protein [Clostridiaceae bacterium]